VFNFRSNIRQGITGWKTDWPRMVAQLVVSALLGQGLFWRLGYDQFSIGGKANRVMQIGFGQRVAEWFYLRLPHTRRAIYTTKAVEIAFDLGKCPLEGATYTRLGITPDVVACAVTQPAWSVIEAAEKLASLLLNLESYRQVDEEEFKASIACIYGSLFRYGQALAILAFGRQIDHYLTRPLARFTRRTGPVVPVASLAIAAWLTRGAINDYRKQLMKAQAPH
jgi:hypothetical protein